MLSYCCPTHSLLRSPKPHSSLRSGGTWLFRDQEEQPCCEPMAVVSGLGNRPQSQGARSPGVGPKAAFLLSWLAVGWLAFPSDLCSFLVDHAVLRLCQPFSLFVCLGAGGQEEVVPGMEGAVRLTGLLHISGCRGGQPDTAL